MAKLQSLVRSFATSTWGPLALFALGQCALFSVYCLTEVELSDLSSLLIETSPGVAIAMWVVSDAHLGSRTPCCDFGLFTAWGMPVVPLRYIFRTRGWRGFGTLVGLVTVVYLPFLWSITLSLLLSDAY